jgi:ATP adenylyltransferase
MGAQARMKPDVGRFASLLSEEPCPRPIYDEILLETHNCVVTPTLGSILPSWLLVIPRTPAINFAQWEAERGANPSILVGEILAEFGIGGHRVIWFEHGPSVVGSAVGCGVDQAHLHVIVDPPFTFSDFVSAATEAGQLAWQQRTARTAHRSVKAETPYLIAASMDDAVVAESVESVGSQFFRRVIANLIQQPDAWNYRTHPYIDNVRETIRTFGGRK